MEQKISIEGITLQEIVTKLGIEMDSNDLMLAKYIEDAGRKQIESLNKEEMQKALKEFEQVIDWDKIKLTEKGKAVEPYLQAFMAKLFYYLIAEKYG